MAIWNDEFILGSYFFIECLFSLMFKELVAFANAKGGTLYLGIEDDGEVTGCKVEGKKQVIN